MENDFQLPALQEDLLSFEVDCSTAIENNIQCTAAEEELKCTSEEGAIRPSCPICDKSFRNNSKRNFPMRKIHNVEPFSRYTELRKIVCPLSGCRQNLFTLSDLREHIVRIHEIDLEVKTFPSYEDSNNQGSNLTTSEIKREESRPKKAKKNQNILAKLSKTWQRKFLTSGRCLQFKVPDHRMAEENEVNDHEMSEEKNGEAMDTDSKSKELADYGLNESVVTKLEELFTTGKLTFSELDERALEALKEFPVDGALTVLKEFMDSSLEHVSNKSAYLCGIMKTYHLKTKRGAQAVTAKGPDEEKIKAILERTGYALEVTTGQRKYGGPPPNWDKAPPGSGCEVFVGKIPKTIFEDELIPVFEKCGQIWDLRLMMDPLTGQNHGYAFITYCNKEAAQAAVKQLDNYEIKSGKKLKVTVSVQNLRLFVGNIPKSKSKEEIFEEFGKLTVGLTEVIIYSSPDDKRKNRGFCFLEYESHKAASLAKRKLGTGRIKVWGCDIIVDWADPQEEPDEETMAKVKVLYARNLTADLTEEKLKEMFEEFGKVDRVKKIKDYAFIHFAERDPAVKAMEEVNGKQHGGSTIEVSLAKPPSDKKKKEEVLRNRERRMMQTIGRGGGMMGMLPTPPRGRGGRLPPNTPRSFDYDYDYYGGYNDYPAGGGGGYGEPPYYEDFYAPPYEDYGYDYGYSTPPRPYPPTRPPPPPPPPERVPRAAGGRVARSAAPRGASARSRGTASRGRGGARGSSRGAGGKAGVARGGKPRGNMAGKRKFDSGHQNQGASKRRFQNSRGAVGNNSWGNQPIPQQPRGASGGDVEWYQDSFGQQWA